MTTSKFGLTLPLIGDKKGDTIATLASNFQLLDDYALSGEQSLDLLEIETPENPEAGRLRIYAKSNDERLYRLTSAGVETLVGMSDFSGETALNLAEVATPGTPLAGRLMFYSKTDDKLYKKTSAGVESEVGPGISGEIAFDLLEVATPASPNSGRAKLYFKSDDKLYKKTSGGVESEVGVSAGSSAWTQETHFTATPASTSTLTMTADLTGTIFIGYGLKYIIGGTTYYGIVTAITSNLLTLAGAPLGGSITSLYWSTPTRVTQVDFFIPGAFADAANTTLLATDGHTKFRWGLTKAYCVQINHTVRIADTGANQSHGTASIAGSVVGTDNTNAGLTFAVTWTPTVVGINTTNYDINYGEAIEIVTDAAGSNDDAVDLTMSLVFVIP
jgi:hypothetical protein